MSIERLDEEIILPYNQEAILSKDRERLNEYIKQLIGDLERFRLRDIHERLNLLIDLTGAGAIFYLGTKDSTGDYPNGTWRINGSSSTAYLIQVKIAGTWTTQSNLSNASLFTIANAIVSGLTASRLIATNGSKQLASVADLTAWIAGTANEITVTSDGDGTVTLALVTPLAVNKGGTGVATLTDHGLLLGSGTDAVTPLGAATHGQIPIGSTGADPVLATITGTANQITVTNAAGSITLSTPQDIHTGASPTFAGLTTTGGRISATTRITADDSPYTVLVTTHYLYCDTDNGAIEVVLPAGVDGTVYNIKNVGSSGHDVTITPDGTEEIEDESDAVLEDRWCYTLQFETTENWRVA